MRGLSLWQTPDQNRLALKASIGTKIGPIDATYAAPRQELAHSHPAQVRKLRALVRVSLFRARRAAPGAHDHRMPTQQDLLTLAKTVAVLSRCKAVSASTASQVLSGAPISPPMCTADRWRLWFAIANAAKNPVCAIPFKVASPAN
jgi:hypothetical protein